MWLVATLVDRTAQRVKDIQDAYTLSSTKLEIRAK
jgi:hypothetical protein